MEAKSGGTHDVLKRLPGEDAQLEMRDGDGNGQVVSRQLQWRPRGRLKRARARLGRGWNTEGTENGKWVQRPRYTRDSRGVIGQCRITWTLALDRKISFPEHETPSHQAVYTFDRATAVAAGSIITIMTTYIPSLTLPTFLFENPAAAILLPVACGTAIGFSISRMTALLISGECH
jgi:hypothetical protein